MLYHEKRRNDASSPVLPVIAIAQENPLMTHPKIIQIAVSGDDDADTIYALRDDGSVWFCFRTHEGQHPWTQMLSPDEHNADNLAQIPA